jgi:hypothetical protein
MRFKVAGPHREFFQKNGYIELESMLTPEDIAQLSSAADKLLEKRLSDQIEFRSAEELYRVGHDLWREDATLRKKITSHNFAEIGAELFKKSSLHLAYDQLLRTGSTPGLPKQLPSTLNEITSIYPLAGALLIHLFGNPSPSDLIPSQHENVIYLSPDKTIPWELFFQLPHQSYLLIAYANPESVYVLQKKDPHTHALKKLGYVFGDRIQHDHHPIVFRKN